ncbi:MAG: hypothetical protein ACRYG4_23260 [Janthinobacterium lividum]
MRLSRVLPALMLVMLTAPAAAQTSLTLPAAGGHMQPGNPDRGVPNPQPPRSRATPAVPARCEANGGGAGCPARPQRHYRHPPLPRRLGAPPA